MHRHLTIAGVLLVLLALCSRSADGCICTIPGQPSRALQLSEVVFTGKVVGFNQDNGTAVLVVYSAWKGVSPWKNQIEVGMDFSDCFYELKLGQEYLLYAGKGEGQKLVTDTCYPNRLLAEAKKDLDELGRSKWRWRHHRR
jgi:hypothetical protein